MSEKDGKMIKTIGEMFAHDLLRLRNAEDKNKIVSRLLIHRRIIRKYSCHISPKAQISFSVSFPHPTGVVIGDGAVIGNESVIYQHVTLGQNHGKYPVVGKGVIIYSGAVVCGPITIGDGAVVGANAVVTHDVPPKAIVAGVPAKVIKYRNESEILF